MASLQVTYYIYVGLWIRDESRIHRHTVAAFSSRFFSRNPRHSRLSLRTNPAYVGLSYYGSPTLDVPINAARRFPPFDAENPPDSSKNFHFGPAGRGKKRVFC